MNFSSSKLLSALAKRVQATEIRMPDKTETKFNKLLYDISKTYFDIAAKTARSCGHKTITENDVKLMSDVAHHMRGGAETVLPSEYFGKDSGAYSANGNLTEPPFVSDDLARPALTYAATGGGCPCAARASFMHQGGGTPTKKASKKPNNKKINKKSNKKLHVGGAETVLPAEYFGKDSGQYFVHDVVSMEPMSDALAHNSLTSTFSLSGGGSHASDASSTTTRLPDDVFSKVWQEYKARIGSAREMRMSIGARNLLRNLIGTTVSNAVKHAHVKRATRALTPACIDHAIKNYSVFP